MTMRLTRAEKAAAWDMLVDALGQAAAAADGAATRTAPDPEWSSSLANAFASPEGRGVVLHRERWIRRLSAIEQVLRVNRVPASDLLELVVALGDLNNGISHPALIRSTPAGRTPKSIPEKINRRVAWGAVMRLKSFGENQTAAVCQVAKWIDIDESTLRSDRPRDVQAKASAAAFADQFALEDEGKPARLKKALLREVFGKST